MPPPPTAGGPDAPPPVRTPPQQRSSFLLSGGLRQTFFGPPPTCFISNPESDCLNPEQQLLFSSFWLFAFWARNLPEAGMNDTTSLKPNLTGLRGIGQWHSDGHPWGSQLVKFFPCCCMCWDYVWAFTPKSAKMALLEKRLGTAKDETKSSEVHVCRKLSAGTFHLDKTASAFPHHTVQTHTALTLWNLHSNFVL